MSRLPALLTGAFLLLSAASAEPSRSCAFRQETDLATLALHPSRGIDYGAFRWLVVPDAEATRLAAAGRADLIVPEAGEVQVPGFEFDPLREGEPVLGSAERAPEGDAGLRLVQLWGPPRADWYGALEAAGLRVLQYYPHNSYLVWSDAAAAERRSTASPSCAGQGASIRPTSSAAPSPAGPERSPTWWRSSTSTAKRQDASSTP